LVTALAAPIRDLTTMVGPGWSTGAGPAPVFAAVRARLSVVSDAAAGSWRTTELGWAGPAAEAAREFGSSTVTAVEALAVRADQLGAAAAQASEAVARARTRLQTILDEFEARAAAMDLDSPGAEEELAAEAQQALDEAIAVVDELRAELDGHAAAVSQPPPAATSPASANPGAGGLSGPSDWGGSAASPLGSGLGSRGGSGLGGGAPSSAGLSDLGSDFGAPESPRLQADPEMFGSGVAVALPDGSAATAPNALAADAVRHALTQLGVPYDWGGTTPGVGLDCSGLTQWAYHEAGLDLPRLAQEQDVGAAVNQGALRPGDLAVWDGHVAMVVGNGLMIEAGDPVKLSPIRTTNAGQGFQGFFRPTE
jgi:cell wall-associated NlpC family hydrolase